MLAFVNRQGAFGGDVRNADPPGIEEPGEGVKTPLLLEHRENGFGDQIVLWKKGAGNAGQAFDILEPINRLIAQDEIVKLSTPVADIVHVGRGDTVAAGTVVAKLGSTLETIALPMT